MRKISFYLFTILFASAALISCESEDSSSVDQDRIFTGYELFYNQNTDKTYARAQFRFGNAVGTTLELAEGSNVVFEGEELGWKPLLAYYELELAGFVNTGTFAFTDTEGTTYQNAIQINEIDYPSNLTTIDRSSAFELAWTGNALAADETVVLTANGENEGDARIFTTNTDGATSIILGQNLLSQIGVGLGTLWMDRTFEPDIQDAPSAGGYTKGRYRPTNASVTFE